MAHHDKCADFFIDGQNLFLSVKSHFGYLHPNFDVLKLCQGLAKSRDMEVGTIHFYTGMPGLEESPHWHDYWSRRLADLGKNGVKVFNPPLRYTVKRETLPDGTTRFHNQAAEKGVDVRMALDMFKCALAGTTNLFLLSQDNDLGIAAKEVRELAVRLGQDIEISSVYPVSEYRSGRGIDGTTWIPMDKSIYDYYLDSRDFRSAGMKMSHEEQQRRRNAFNDPRLIGQRPRFDHEASGHRPRQQGPEHIPNHPFMGVDDALRLQRAASASQVVPPSQPLRSSEVSPDTKP